MQIRDLGEFGLIDRIKDIVGEPARNVVLGISDDAAAVNSAGDALTLLTTDALVENVGASGRQRERLSVGFIDFGRRILQNIPCRIIWGS